MSVMRHYPFKASELTRVSHDPELFKRLLVDEPVSCIRSVSSITLGPGDTASEHSHPDDIELFYCVKGLVTVCGTSEPVKISEGDVLVIEPGERHSITEVAETTQLLYMRISR